MRTELRQQPGMENRLALTLAKVTIQSVRIERWWTNAFTRLHALLVRFAFVVAGAPLLSR